MLCIRKLLLVAIAILFAESNHANFASYRPFLRKVMAAGIFTSNILNFSRPNFADSTFQDQLKVVKALQLEDQKSRIKSINGDTNGLQDYQIVKGLVYLFNSQERIDTTEYPFGLPDAASLDSELANEKAALILTAVGKDGPPFAVKRFPLKRLVFPFPFEITAQDLMFPYTAEAWSRSPIARGSLSVTCVLDTDGKLETPSVHDRFGYAISARINPGMPSSAAVSTSSDSNFIERSDVKINLSFKSDGSEYSDGDLELLRRIDAELDRLSTATTK